MMRIIITGIVLLGLATPTLAARVYLKGGGVIEAKSVWRSAGKVHVLINRDTLTEFPQEEIDMKRTFVKRHRAPKKTSAIASGGAVINTPAESAAAQKPAEKKPGLSLPSMPKLPEAKPENLIKSGDEGTIRKHKREMIDRANE